MFLFLTQVQERLISLCPCLLAYDQPYWSWHFALQVIPQLSSAVPTAVQLLLSQLQSREAMRTPRRRCPPEKHVTATSPGPRAGDSSLRSS